MDELVALVTSGAISLRVADVYPFADTAAAHDRLCPGRRTRRRGDRPLVRNGAPAHPRSGARKLGSHSGRETSSRLSWRRPLDGDVASNLPGLPDLTVGTSRRACSGEFNIRYGLSAGH